MDPVKGLAIKQNMSLKGLTQRLEVITRMLSCWKIRDVHALLWNV